MNEKKVFESKDAISLKLFEGILIENDIPYNIHSNRFMRSETIYVSDEDFEKAKELLEIFNEQKLNKKYGNPLKLGIIFCCIIWIIIFIAILKILIIALNVST